MRDFCFIQRKFFVRDRMSCFFLRESAEKIGMKRERIHWSSLWVRSFSCVLYGRLF